MKHSIVLVSFPFDDLTAMKVRPAVCLTEPIGSRSHIVVAFISSKLPDETLPSDVIVADTDAGFKQTGLHVSSSIRLHRMLTISAKIVRRKLGTLSPVLAEEVRRKLHQLFCV